MPRAAAFRASDLFQKPGRLDDGVEHGQRQGRVSDVGHDPAKLAPLDPLALRPQIAGDHRNARFDELAQSIAERLGPDGELHADIDLVREGLTHDVLSLMGAVVDKCRAVDSADLVPRAGREVRIRRCPVQMEM